MNNKSYDKEEIRVNKISLKIIIFPILPSDSEASAPTERYSALARLLNSNRVFIEPS